MTNFDVGSLLTNVPLQETIDLSCVENLFDKKKHFMIFQKTVHFDHE